MTHKKILSLWGLKWNPFSPGLPVDALLATGKIVAFAWRVEQLVQEGGFAMITGEPGTGKSVAMRIVAQRLSTLRDVVVGVLERPQSKNADFYRELGDIFSVKLSPSNRWGGFRALRERWKSHVATSRIKPVLLVDEAQEMKPDVLSELRILSSAEFDATALLTVVLAGDGRLVCPQNILEWTKGPSEHSNWGSLSNLQSGETRMVTRIKKRKSPASKKRCIGKPTGQIQQRVEAVGPEHFGIVAVDCAKQRSKWMVCNFYGKVLVEPTSVEHTTGGLRTMTEVVAAVRKAEGLTDTIVAVEMTGIYHKPVYRAFRKAGFDTRIVHPFASNHYRRPLHPDDKTDDNDLEAIFHAAVNGYGLATLPVDEVYQSLQAISRHRHTLVKQRSRLMVHGRKREGNGAWSN